MEFRIVEQKEECSKVAQEWQAPSTLEPPRKSLKHHLGFVLFACCFLYYGISSSGAKGRVQQSCPGVASTKYFRTPKKKSEAPFRICFVRMLFSLLWNFE